MLLVLFSALLGAWELLGCKVDGKLGGVLSIEHQYLVPWVLLLCTLYYGFRVNVEWFQSDNRRRTAAASMLDVTAAYGIAASAVLVFITEKILGVNIGDLLKGAPALVALIAFACGAAAIWPFRAWVTRQSMTRAKLYALGFLFVIVPLVISVLLPLVVMGIAGWSAFVFFAAGAASHIGVQRWYRWFARRWRRAPEKRADSPDAPPI